MLTPSEIKPITTLSFQSIISSVNCKQHHKRSAKYRTKQTNQYYCSRCAIQLASRGTKIEQLQTSKKLQQGYIQIQSLIRKQIQQYNKIFNTINQMLIDLRIRDLTKFNQVLDQNEQKWNNFNTQNFHGCGEEIRKKLEDLRDVIMEYIQNQSNKSSMASKKYVKANKQNISPPSNIKTENISLEDTPQSIKSKISINKPEKIGMFDKIDICESIDGCIKNQKDYRYGKCSIE